MKIIKLLFLVALILQIGCKKKEEAQVEQIRPVKAIQAQTAADLLSKGLPAV